jgi:NitT/TauT family transport system permease protein
MIKSVPVASFVVICLIWLSARNLSVFISFLIVIPIIYQNVLEGLRAENREMQEVATVFQLPWRKRFRYIELPKIRPFLLSACRVTTGMAWKAGIAAEIIGVPNGSIGKMLYTAKIYLDTDDLLAWTVIIVVISVVAEKVFLAGLSRLLNPCSRFMEDTDAGH